MSNCLMDLRLSQRVASKRLQRACEVLGTNIVNRIIGFALFLMGGDRKDIANYLGFSYGTYLSFLTRIHQCGLFAFQDRRQKTLPKERIIDSPHKVSLSMDEKNILLMFDGTDVKSPNRVLSISRGNPLQTKVVLLSFYHSGLLSLKEIAHIIGMSERHIRDLNEKLCGEDVLSLIDKRIGQVKDYRFTPEIKSELVQQYTAHAMTGKSTSSQVLAEQIHDRCQVQLSARSIRFHVKKLGLRRLVKSLPLLVDDLKKTAHADFRKSK